jgi:hypothetical protein
MCCVSVPYGGGRMLVVYLTFYHNARYRTYKIHIVCRLFIIAGLCLEELLYHKVALNMC